MARIKVTPSRDRREADLLLTAVLAHMAYSSAKSAEERESAYQRFKEAVQNLDTYLSATDSQRPLD